MYSTYKHDFWRVSGTKDGLLRTANKDAAAKDAAETAKDESVATDGDAKVTWDLQQTTTNKSNTNKQVIFHFFMWLETISSCYTSRIIGFFFKEVTLMSCFESRFGLWFHGLSTMTGPVHVHQTHSSGHLKRVTVTQRLIISVGCFSWVSWHAWRW